MLEFLDNVSVYVFFGIQLSVLLIIYFTRKRIIKKRDYKDASDEE